MHAKMRIVVSIAFVAAAAALAVMPVGAQSTSQAAAQTLREMRVQMFVRDLENHDYTRLWLHFDAQYLEGRISIMHAADYPLTDDLLDQILCNGALMFDSYSNTFGSVRQIVSVRLASIGESTWGVTQVRFIAALADGRSVGFSLFLKQDTCTFYGPAG